MKKIYLLAFILLVTAGCKLNAQTVKITGEGITPYILTKGEFTDMKQAVIMAKAHDEKMHRYTGVPIADLLVKAGIMLGDSAKRKTIMSYVIVTAADNYRAIYSLGEIDPLFANRTIILADRADKKALPVEEGPFQIIVPGEKKHARWIRQVVSIEVVIVK
jgi:hypothetical protein